MVLQYDKENDKVLIEPEKLCWVLGCARDMLKKDFEYFAEDSPFRKLVASNLEEIETAIDFVDNL
mgnify:CR=1 FL=1